MVWRDARWSGVARAMTRRIGLLAVPCWLAACAAVAPNAAQPDAVPARTQADAQGAARRHQVIPSPDLWGGEARCKPAASCRLVAVEHETSRLVLYQFGGRGHRLLDRQPLAYHPDGAAWIDDHHVVAAVEMSRSLDIFHVDGDGRMQPRAQIVVGFQPRDVVVLPEKTGGWLMLATPYRGDEVAWVHWRADGTHDIRLQKWCATPWHVAWVPRGPGGRGPGLVTSCLDDHRVLFMPEPQTWDQVTATRPLEVRRFDHVPRRVGVSPSGRYWYVALELGGRVARYDVEADRWQMLPFTEFGAVGVAPLDDDTVAWGENNRVLVVRYDAEGTVLAQRSLPVSGLPTQLQWVDLDGDGEPDLLSLNSTGPASDVHYGPVRP